MWILRELFVVIEKCLFGFFWVSLLVVIRILGGLRLGLFVRMLSLCRLEV